MYYKNKPTKKPEMKEKPRFLKIKSAYLGLVLICMGSGVTAQSLDGYLFRDNPDVPANMTTTEFQFNGYTNYCHHTIRANARKDQASMFRIAERCISDHPPILRFVLIDGPRFTSGRGL
jgi:hypothetical protein